MSALQDAKMNLEQVQLHFEALSAVMDHLFAYEGGRGQEFWKGVLYSE